MPNDWMWEKSKLDPAYSGMDRGYNSRTGGLAPSPLTAPVTAASRVIPPPTGSNWNSTFLNNQPSSPSGTDWQKAFSASPSFVSSPSPAATRPMDEPRRSLGEGGSFSFSLSPSANQSQLSLPQSDFQDRTANLDLTTRDHELYGAGPDLGFNY